MNELELTPDIQQWLETPPDERDIYAGAQLLLRVSRNRILYNNIIRNPLAKASLLEYHLRKILDRRLPDTSIGVKSNTVEAQSPLVLDAPRRTAFQNGKRPDHDELPEEVRNLYVVNADIMRRMREAHTRLRLITTANSSNPDVDRAAITKEITLLDRQYRDNWNRYDHYVKDTPVESTVMATDPRTVQKNTVKILNLLLGKYAKTPNKANAERIKQLYATVANPSDELCKKMIAAKLL